MDRREALLSGGQQPFATGYQLISSI